MKVWTGLSLGRGPTIRRGSLAAAIEVVGRAGARQGAGSRSPPPDQAPDGPSPVLLARPADGAQRRRGGRNHQVAMTTSPKPLYATVKTHSGRS